MGYNVACHFTVPRHQTFFLKDKNRHTVSINCIRYEVMLKTFFKIEETWSCPKTNLISPGWDPSTCYQFGHSVFKPKIW